MPFSSPFRRLSIPETDIWTFLFERPSIPFPHSKPIYIDGPSLRSFSLADVRTTAIAFGQGLKSMLEFRQGDVLAFFTPNCVDTPAATFGALWAGAVISPANPGYTVAELVYQLRDSGARAVVTQWDFVETVRKACREVGIDEETGIILIGDQRDPLGKVKHWMNVRNISSAARYRRPKVKKPKSEVAFLVYSSGTTGTPKGVKLSHYNMVSNLLQLYVGEGQNLTWDGSKTVGNIPLPRKGSGGDKILACLPFFHIYGLTALIMQPAYLGLTELIMPKFDIEFWCRLVQDHQITYSYIVPPIVLLLTKHPKVSEYDLSSIRMTNSGAAPLTEDLVKAVYKRTGVRVKQGYGLSETSPAAFQQRWEDWDKVIGSTGPLLPNMEAKFCEVSETGDSEGWEKRLELPEGETGELYVKGPNIFLGYHNRLEATRECLTMDGWFRTGDVGYLDKDGNLFITDRAKELIKYKGFQVPPAELEGYLVDHELVQDVAVVGVESPELGTEVPRAYIVRKGGVKAVEQGDDRKIMDWLAAKVANHKKIRGGVRFIDAVPKSATGKILRRILKEEAKREYKGGEKVRAKL